MPAKRPAPGPQDHRENALSSLTTIVSVLGANDGGFTPPTIGDFFPGALAFEGTFFQFDRITLVRVVAALVLVVVFSIGASRARLVPGRFQNALEMILDFVRVQISEEVLGKHKGAKYTAFLTTIFCTVLVFNLTGLVPGLNIAGTSLIGLPIVLALWVYVMYLGAGIRAQGVGGFLRTSLFPPGVPVFLYLLLTPIEFLQVFVLRPATLAIRLMANMVAGHLMLAICFAATQFFVFEAAAAMKGFGAVTVVAALAFSLFEVFVAVLQAYVFAILAAVYINLSVEAEH